MKMDFDCMSVLVGDEAWMRLEGILIWLGVGALGD